MIIPGNAFKIEKLIERHRTEFGMIGDNPDLRGVLDHMPLDHALIEIGIGQPLEIDRQTVEMNALL